MSDCRPENGRIYGPGIVTDCDGSAANVAIRPRCAHVRARVSLFRVLFHACTLATVPTWLARVPTPPTVQRFSGARR